MGLILVVLGIIVALLWSGIVGLLLVALGIVLMFAGR